MLGLPSLKSKNCFEKYLRVPEKIESRFQKTPEFLQIIWRYFWVGMWLKLTYVMGFPVSKKKKIH